MEQAAASRTPFLGALPVTSKSKPSGLDAESERIACRTIEGSIEREEQLSMFEGLEDKVADKADTCLKRYLPESVYSYVEAFNNAPWKVGPDMTFDRSRSAALNILLFVFLILWSVETQFLDDDGRTDVIENLYVRGILMVFLLAPIAVVNNSERDISTWRWVGAVVFGVYLGFYYTEYMSNWEKQQTPGACSLVCTISTFYIPVMVGILFVCLAFYLRVIFTHQDAYLKKKQLNRKHVQSLLKGQRAAAKEKGEEGEDIANEETRAQIFLRVQEQLRPLYGNDSKGLIAGSILVVKHMEELKRVHEEEVSIVELAKRQLEEMKKRDLKKDVQEASKAAQEKLRKTMGQMNETAKQMYEEARKVAAERDVRKAAAAVKNSLLAKREEDARKTQERVKKVDDFRYLPSLVIVSSIIIMIVILGIGIAMYFLAKPLNKVTTRVVQKVDPSYVTNRFLDTVNELESGLTTLLDTVEDFPAFPEQGEAVDAINAYFTQVNTTITNTLDQSLGLQAQMEELYQNILELNTHFAGSFRTANILACMISLAFAARSVYAFRRAQIQLRQGDYFSINHPHMEKKFNQWCPAFQVAKSQRYLGLLLGSFLGGYIVVLLVLFLIIVVLSWPATWRALYQNVGAIVAIVISVLNVVLWDKIVVHQFLSDGFWIKRPVPWTWFQAFAIVMATVTGIYFAIVRLVLLLVFGVASMFCLDFSIYPESQRGLDKGYASFVSIALMAHRHRSPTLQGMSELFKGVRKRKAAIDTSTADGETSFVLANDDTLEANAYAGGGEKADPAFLLQRNRWQLAYTLLNNPSLIPLRGGTMQLNRDDEDDEDSEGAAVAAAATAAGDDGVDLGWVEETAATTNGMAAAL